MYMGFEPLTILDSLFDQENMGIYWYGDMRWLGLSESSWERNTRYIYRKKRNLQWTKYGDTIGRNGYAINMISWTVFKPGGLWGNYWNVLGYNLPQWLGPGERVEKCCKNLDEHGSFSCNMLETAFKVRTIDEHGSWRYGTWIFLPENLGT